MERKVLAEKFIVLGVDGMDPRLTKKYLDAGVMPNLQAILKKGVAREDLVLLGNMPTITPPMWTTLATGAYPVTHGITCFWRQDPNDLEAIDYNLDSKNCKAEQLWNVTAEAGKKTLVFHWPGSSWPPTSKRSELHVVDGSQPAAINMGIAMVDGSYLITASEAFTEFRVERPKNDGAAGAGCIITGLEIEPHDVNISAIAFSTKPVTNIMLRLVDGEGNMELDSRPRVMTPIKPATGWVQAPKDAKEFAFTLRGGFVRRVGLICANEAGLYDTVAIYKSKADKDPLTIIKNGEADYQVLDQYHLEGKQVLVNLMYLALEIAPDGSKVRLIAGNAMDYSKNDLFYPHELYDTVTEQAGYVPASPTGAGEDPEIIEEYYLPAWDYYNQWQAKAINALIKENDYEAVFSHLHNIDCMGHQFWAYAKDRKRTDTDEKQYQGFLQAVYEQTDRYFAQFIHLLDKGWAMLIVSDHGLVTSYEEEPCLLGDPLGVNAGLMAELGYTVLHKNADNQLRKAIDWEHTKALAVRGNYIWINLKGRNKHGIVDPEEKYALEEQIMNDLYGYRDAKGNRVVSIVLRNKDAAIFGLNGPETGDLVYWTNEGTNRCHGDSLSTTWGYADTSVSPIFIAAGRGFKQGVLTERIIRQVDVAPTIAYMSGLRLPADNEGSIVHQILADCNL